MCYIILVFGGALMTGREGCARGVMYGRTDV